MFFSKSFIPTLRQDPKAAECASHKLMLKASLVYMVSSGIYAYLPIGLRVLHKIEAIIRKRMDEEGAQELFLSALQPLELWKKTGRDRTMQEVMFTIHDRRQRDLCLGPTHEEEITEIVRRYITSYRQLPVTLYQIQSKFRDEARPRFGLMRSCEFIMKDAYSFDIDEKGLDESYQKMHGAYLRILEDCELTFITANADSGAMGGSFSQEFMVPAPIGEDVVFKCAACGTYEGKGETCSACKGKLSEEKVIEVGHVFKLGTKYSIAQDAYVLDRGGNRIPLMMGCYGIGVSRLLPAIIEQNYDAKGIIWPRSVSPFDVSLLVLETENAPLFEAADTLYKILTSRGFDLLFDERKEPAGVKFNDAYLLGNPYIVIVGKRFLSSGKYELEIRRTGKKYSLSREELITFLKNEQLSE